jgi:putative lipoic acid-binding regulatory protein
MYVNMAIENSSIQFPCSFPLKVMGLNNELFEPAVRAVFETFVGTGPITYAKQLSSGDKYVSITATFTAKSREQLDALYRALNKHELVVMTL